MNKRIIYAMVFLLFISIVSAPPTPHNIRGRVFHNDGSFATGGIPLIINVSVTNFYITSRTNGFGPPRIDASYSDSVNGSDGDTVIVIAYNSTWYGINTTLLVSPTTWAFVTMNNMRPSETNVTITAPQNNSAFNASVIFQVNATVAVIGGQDGTNCQATISFNNTNVLRLYQDSWTHNLGDITLGSSATTTWNVTGNLTGNSNIVVYGNCSSDGVNLERLNYYRLDNITIYDFNGPGINLIAPGNNSMVTDTGSAITFSYNVSDGSEIANCSLLINDAINTTNFTVQRYTTQVFNAHLSNRTYNWSVQCYDNLSNYGISVKYNFSIISNLPPVITNMIVDTPIDLNIGSFVTVYCNATVTDMNNISDIHSVNSTLFLNSTGAVAPDDNNNHYSLNPCQAISNNTYSINFSCAFDVYYYANNGSWACNITAGDKNGVVRSDKVYTAVSELLAIDVFPGVIDFGELAVGNSSGDDIIINVTNWGNMDFNLTLDGYGTEDGDNIAMNCSKGNISIDLERYSVVFNESYDVMVNLTDTATVVGNFSLPHRTDDISYKSDRNNTYWKISIPPGIQGNCTGIVVFNTIQI